MQPMLQQLPPKYKPSFVLDSVTGASCAYSMRRLTKAYTGPCLTVQLETAATLNVGFTRRGDFDVVAYNAFVAGHTPTILTWYDQMGSSTPASNLLRLTQATAANQPTLNLTWKNNRPAVQFRSAGSQQLTAANAFAVALAQPTTSHLVGSFDGAYNDNNTAIFHSGPTALHLNQLGKRNSNFWFLNAGTSLAGLQLDDTAPNIFTAMFNNTTSFLRVNGRQVFTGTTSTNDWTQLRVGADQTPNYSNVSISELIIFNSNTNATQVTIQSSQSAYYQIPCISVGHGSTVLAGTGATTRYNQATTKVLPSGIVMLCYNSLLLSASGLNGNQMHIRFSADYGATWSTEDKWTDGTAITYLLSGVTTNWPATLPTLTGNQGLAEPWIIRCPNGDLLILTWRSDYAGADNGTYQIRSTNGGRTWGEWAQVTVASLPGGDSQNETFITDDDFVIMSGSGKGTIYTGARVMQTTSANNNTIGAQRNILLTSTDNGVTWTYKSDITSYTSCNGLGTLEVGLEYVGNNTIIAMLRPCSGSVTLAGWTARSTDMGATWAAATEVTSTALSTARPRVKTRSHLVAGGNVVNDLSNSWSSDPVLIMCGFVGWGNLVSLATGTAASPSVFTTVGAVAHNLTVGDLVVTTTIVQNGSAVNPNGHWLVNTTPSASTFTLKTLAGVVLNNSGSGWTGGSVFDSTTDDNRKRRVAMWVSYDRGVTWCHPIFLDTEYGQGYGDMFYDPLNGWYVNVTTKATIITAADTIEQYKFALVGL